MAHWFPNAYPVEMFQAVTSIAATLILFWAAFDAVKAAIGLPATERNGARWTLAIGNVHRAFFRLLKSMVLTVAGITALFLPPPPPLYRELIDSPEMREGALVVRVAIIAVTLLLLMDASVERMFRQRYVRKIRMNGDDVAPRLPNDRRHPPNGERVS
jgi:hypothetical protein